MNARKIARTVWVTAAVVWAAVGLANIPAAVDALSPDIHTSGPEVPTRTPTAVRTSHSAPYPIRVDKVRLQIQQNPGCWNAIPGRTCGPERTYR